MLSLGLKDAEQNSCCGIVAMSLAQKPGLPPLPRGARGGGAAGKPAPHAQRGEGFDSPSADAWKDPVDPPVMSSPGYSTPNTSAGENASRQSAPGNGHDLTVNESRTGQRDLALDMPLKSSHDMSDMPSSWGSLQDLIGSFQLPVSPTSDSAANKARSLSAPHLSRRCAPIFSAPAPPPHFLSETRCTFPTPPPCHGK